MKQTNKTATNIFRSFFVMYILILIYLTLFSPYYGRIYFHRSFNFIPFKTIISFIKSSYKLNLEVVITNILGNIIAFIPMGFFLPIVFKKMNRFKIVVYIILFSTSSIEIFQYLLGVGTTDIDDIILNTLGGILGFILYRIGVKIIRSKELFYEKTI